MGFQQDGRELVNEYLIGTNIVLLCMNSRVYADMWVMERICTYYVQYSVGIALEKNIKVSSICMNFLKMLWQEVPYMTLHSNYE